MPSAVSPASTSLDGGRPVAAVPETAPVRSFPALGGCHVAAAVTMVSAMPGSIWFFMTCFRSYGLQLPAGLRCCGPALPGAVAPRDLLRLSGSGPSAPIRRPGPLAVASAWYPGFGRLAGRPAGVGGDLPGVGFGVLDQPPVEGRIVAAGAADVRGVLEIPGCEQFRRHSRVATVPARVHRVQVCFGGSHLESSPVRGGWSGGRAGGQSHGGGVGLACLVQPADADLAAGVVALQGALDVRGRGDLVAADGGDLVAGLQASLGGG